MITSVSCATAGWGCMTTVPAPTWCGSTGTERFTCKESLSYGWILRARRMALNPTPEPIPVRVVFGVGVGVRTEIGNLPARVRTPRLAIDPCRLLLIDDVRLETSTDPNPVRFSAAASEGATGGVRASSALTTATMHTSSGPAPVPVPVPLPLSLASSSTFTCVESWLVCTWVASGPETDAPLEFGPYPKDALVWDEVFGPRVV